jgi:hypothetical protein
LNAHKEKKEKYQQVKTKKKKKIWPKRRSQRVTSKITHKQILKTGLSHLSKNPITENFEEKLLNEKESYCCDQT